MKEETERILTDEEANREITLERFTDYHHTVGECFVDQHGFVDHKIFGGYLMCLHPQWSKEILKVLNDKYGEALGLLHIYEDELGSDDEIGWNMFYTDLAIFANLTGNLKKNINQILIQEDEYYNKN